MKRIKSFPFLVFFIMGIFFNLSGLTSAYIAQKIGVDISKIAYSFTVFTLFNTIAVFLNGNFLDKISLKKEITFASLLSIIGIIGLTNSSTYFSLTFFNGIYGFGSGILVSVSNYLILKMYAENIRSSKYSILNFFYSVGAIGGPFFGGLALKNGYKWESIYYFTLIFLVSLSILIFFTNFKFDSKNDSSVNINTNSPSGLNLNSILISIGIMSYVLSEIIFTYWIVQYIKIYIKNDIAIASFGLSMFWIFMAVGRGAAGYILKKVETGKYIVIFSLLAFCGSILLFLSNNITVILFSISVMGLGYSGLYPAILSYGTMQSKSTSPKLMTFFITCGAIGGITALPLSGVFFSNFSLKSAMQISVFFIAVVLITIYTVFRKEQKYKEAI